MKRCVKLTKDFDGDYAIDDGDCVQFICGSGLRREFEVPKTNTVWLNFRKTKAKDYHHFKIVGPELVELGGKIINRTIMISLAVHIFGGTFEDYYYDDKVVEGYVKVEYE